MKLRDFVSTTLLDIVQGVEQAQAELVRSKAEVNPRLNKIFPIAGTGSNTNQGLGWTENNALVSVVQFNVVVTTEEKKSTEGTIGAVVVAFGLSARGSSAKAESEMTRIQFSVPVKLPSAKEAD